MMILCPTRGRPERAWEMVDSLHATARGPVHVCLAVDVDDPELLEYLDMQGPLAMVLVIPKGLRFTGAANLAAEAFWGSEDVLGVVGDDVLYRTPGWDEKVREALVTPGLAYANDLVHGANHPTAIYMSSVIAQALGWIALPSTKHQWADDAWKMLGERLGVLRYLGDDVIVEHMHPAVNKAEWDEGYNRVFDDEAAKHDYAAFTYWSEHEIEADLANVRPVL